MRTFRAITVRKPFVKLGLLCSLYMVSLWAQTMTLGTSDSVAVDCREDAYGKLARGVAAVSTVGTEYVAGTVKVDGKTVADPQAWDTTKLNDGWHEVTLTTGNDVLTEQVLVRNDAAVVFHDGILSADETWAADAVHVVLHDVVVSTDVTLTITDGAIVKFWHDTQLIVRGGTATANTAVLTHWADDTVGGDTNQDGDATRAVYGDYTISGVTLTACNVRYQGVGMILGTSDSVAVDCREDAYGKLARGVAAVSTVGTEYVAGTVKVDGKTVADPQAWDTTKLNDGWHEVTLTTGNDVLTEQVLVRNDAAVVFHDGILSADETWAADAVHVVLHDVVVPMDVTLTITDGAIVKFWHDTQLIVRGGTATANTAVLTHWADDTVGGDTNLDGDATRAVYGDYTISGVTLTACDVRYQGVGMILGTSDSTMLPGIGDGSKMACGMTVLSPYGTEYEAGLVAVDGTGIADPQSWDAATVSAGWHEVTLTSDEGVLKEDILVLDNRTVALHSGILTKHETWSADKMHVVWHDVVVPAGVSLTIAEGAVVKFCEATQLVVRGGTGSANGAVFTCFADDEIGGDTNCDGDASEPSYGTYQLVGSWQLENCDMRYVDTITVDTHWTADSVHVVDILLTVTDGATLTIDDGAIVKFATGAGIVTKNGGSVSAENVVFTHLADDSVGGDTNRDGDASVPVHDSYTLGFTVSQSCDIRYMSLTYAGGTIAAGETKVLAGNRVHKVTGTIIVNGTLVVQPGAIVKMNKGLNITVNQGGTLEALGNRAQPIVFTSYRDDEHGGDTDGDDGEELPDGGDWNGIYVAGTMNSEYATFMYGGPRNESGIIEAKGGTISLNSCVVAHSKYDGIWNWSNGRIQVSNSIITDVGMGACPYTGNNTYTNCIFYENTFGLMYWSHWTGTATFANCIFNKCASGWIDLNGASTFKPVFNNCLFYNPVGYGPQSFVKVGSNGNQWADPLFTDPENGDFSLLAGSPCIDAGDGSVAPEFDYWGKPRMDCPTVANTGIAAANGSVPDIGIYEMPGTGGGEAPDLQVTDVTFETQTYRQGDRLTLSWKDANVGESSAVAPWRDVVSFVQTTDNGRQMVEAAVVTVNASVKPGKETAVTAKVQLPAMLPGEWQVQVAANQYRDVYEGGNAASNILLSEKTFTMKLDELTAGATAVNVPADHSLTYRLTEVKGGAALWLEAPSDAALSLVASAGRIPSAEEYHWKGVAVAGRGWLLEVPKGTTGDVFVTLVNDSDASVAATVTQTAADGMICGSDTASLTNGGMATLVLYGTGMTDVTEVRLGTVSAVEVHALSTMELSTTFDLTDVAADSYAVTLVYADGKSLKADFTVAVTGWTIGPKLTASFAMPESLRMGRWYTGTITYANHGDRDAIAPILYLKGTDVTFLDTDDGFTEWPGQIALAGLAADCEASVIKPGKSYSVKVKFMGTNINESQLGIHFTFLDPNVDALEWRMLLGGDEEALAARAPQLKERFGSPLGLLKQAMSICGQCSLYGRPKLDVLDVCETLAAKPDDVEYGFVSGVLVDMDNGNVLANNSLMILNGDETPSSIRTDDGGRFCAWGGIIGNSLKFGGAEGFFYLLNDDIVLNNTVLSGITVYRRVDHTQNIDMGVST